MEIVINELSLIGQYESEDNFLDYLNDFIQKLNAAKKANGIILKNSEFYDCMVMTNCSLRQLALQSKDDRMRKFKGLLLALIDNPPFWEEDQKHCLSDSYCCKYTNQTNNYGIAEACARDLMVISFYNPLMEEEYFTVIKNSTHTLQIYNISSTQWDYWINQSFIDEITYCRGVFEKSKLNFSLYEESFGFDILEVSEKEAFINSFKLFDQLSWDDILRSDSLQYKKYTPGSKSDNWFKGTSYDGQVYKFRVNEKMRCFGFRDQNTFFVLRFERDHKISDKG